METVLSKRRGVLVLVLLAASDHPQIYNPVFLGGVAIATCFLSLASSVSQFCFVLFFGRFLSLPSGSRFVYLNLVQTVVPSAEYRHSTTATSLILFGFHEASLSGSTYDNM